jgi:hypothetical protein
VSEDGFGGWLATLSELDRALAELDALRRRVAELTAERDIWRARSGL